MHAMLSALALCFVVLSAGEPGQDSLRDRGLVLVPSEGWNPELLEDLVAGVEALPPGARPRTSHPLEVEFHAESTDFGLGDEGHPLLSGDLRRLHLYAWRDGADARASRYLGSLDEPQRRRLWRRRAVVHALVRRLDARLRWSGRAGWRLLAGWQGDRAQLEYAWAFSRSAGMKSAELDLATFAEELLVPPDSLVPGAIPPDLAVRCREPSKSRYLDERLASLDPAWQPRRDCPALERWTRPEDPPRLEVVFTAPSSTATQAAFGHLLLRVVDDEEAPEREAVVQLAALVSPLEQPVAYVGRGLFGGFKGIFSVASLADVRQESLHLEQRSIRRYRLNLDAARRERLLERVVELQRVGYLDYRFFDANCASMLRFLLAPVLDGEPAPVLTPWEGPAQVLDALAARLGPPETDESSGDLARWAAAERRRLLGDLPARQRERLGPVAPQLLSDDQGTARAWLDAALRAEGVDDAWRARVLLASLRVERHRLDLATVARLDAERATILPGWRIPSADELVAARQRRSEEHLVETEAARAELAELLRLDEQLRAVPRRALTPAEQRRADEERLAREDFEAVASAVAALPAAVLDEARAGEQADRWTLLRKDASRRVPESGHGHAELGGGVSLAGAPLAWLRAAGLAEALGDQRERGLGAGIAWQVLDGFVELAPTLASPVQRAQLTVLGHRALAPTGWGWGAGLDYVFRAGAHEVGVGGEATRAVVADGRRTNFLLASVGARAGPAFTPAAAALLNPRAALEARVQLPGSFGNALRVEAAYAPRLLLDGAGARLEHAAAGTARLGVRFGVFGGVALTGHLEAGVDWRASSGLLGRAGVALELD